MFDGSPFEQAVEAQGVNLSPFMRSFFHAYYTTDIGVARDGYGNPTWPPTAEWFALSEAASWMERIPSNKLADQALQPELLPGDTLSQSLGALVNASLRRPRLKNIPAFEPAKGRIDACAAAENGFLDTSAALSLYTKNDSQEPDVRVVLDKQKRPLLVQKSAGNIGSALTLQTVSIGGIPFPAGSIMKISYRGRIEGKPENGLELISARVVKGLSFMRASFFALRPEDRPSNVFIHNADIYGVKLDEISKEVSGAVDAKIKRAPAKFSFGSAFSALLQDK